MNFKNFLRSKLFTGIVALITVICTIIATIFTVIHNQSDVSTNTLTANHVGAMGNIAIGNTGPVNQTIYQEAVPRVGHEIISTSTLGADNLYHTVIYSTFAFIVGAQPTGNYEIHISPADASFNCTATTTFPYFLNIDPNDLVPAGGLEGAMTPINIFWICVSSRPINNEELLFKLKP